MKRVFYRFAGGALILVLFVMSSSHYGKLTSRAAITSVTPITGSALLDSWGNLFAMLGTAVGENSLRTQIRIAIVQLAMFDAVNAAVDGPYRCFASKPAAAPGASPEAAAIRAAYMIALREFPDPTHPTIDAAYNDSIAAVAASPQAIADGILVGDQVGAAVLDARKHDGRNDPDLTGYTPGSGPGAWIPTPGGTVNPQTPFLRFVTPFGYEDSSRFRPAAPPALESKIYTTDFNEIKDVGRLSPTSRTAEQSATARFWSPSASALWIANIRSLAHDMDLLTAARFEALGIAAVENALIATWDAKFAYVFWRPVTAIRAGDTDSNPETEADPLWTPFLTTPSHPEYPAAHTAVGASALGFYTVWFDTDQFALQFKGLNTMDPRNYSSVNEILAEEGNARVWGGMHFRNSTEVGTAMGSKVGKYTATHLLKPLD